MGTTANIFTLKLDNKDFNSQLQQASKTSQDYNSQIANSLLEASRLEQKRVTLLQQRAVAQEVGDKASIKSINQQISAIGSLITAENKRIASINQAGNYLKKNIDLINEQAKASSYAADQEVQNAKKVADLRSGFVSSYVNSSAQNKYNASFAELNTLKSQGVISEAEYAKALRKTQDILKEGEPIRDSQFNHMIRMMHWAGTLAAAFYGVKTAWDATLGTGIETTAQFEQMQIGISALIAANSQNVTSLGKHINASEKFTMAQKDAANAIILLRKANIDTPATLEQLTRGFQSALGPAMALGFNIKQTVEYSKLMTLAASALTVPMEQLSQEMRSILNGTIDQNSIVANSLGLTNEQIKAHKKQGDVYEFLISKLSDFNAAGKAVNQSWQGISSNLSDAWKAFTSDVTKSTGLFEGLKEGMGGLTTLLKNQNGELDTLSRHFTDLAIAVGAFYGVGVLGRAVSVLKEVTLAQYALNAAVNVNPWVIAATAIGGAVLALREYQALSDDIAKSQAKSIGATSFIKDLQFVSGKDTSQQLHDTVVRSREVFKQQQALVAEYNKAWYEKAGKGFEGMSKPAIASRIDALAEEQKSLVKYTETLKKIKSPVTEQATLIAKPPEKTQKELDAEEKARLKALRERNTQELSDLTKIHQAYETQAALEQKNNAESEADFTIKLSSMNKLQALKLEQYNAEEKALQKELSANNSISDEAQRKYQNDITLEKIYKNRTDYANEYLQIQKAQTAEQEKQIKATDRASLRQLELQLHSIVSGTKTFGEQTPFERTFGNGKIPRTQAFAAIGEANKAFDAKTFISDEELAQAKKRVNDTIDQIKAQMIDLPPLVIDVQFKGWDKASEGFAQILNSIQSVTKESKRSTFLQSEIQAEGIKQSIENEAFRSKKSRSYQKEVADTSKAYSTQSMVVQLQNYSNLAGGFASLMKENSKEQKAAQAVQMGLNAGIMVSNALTAISGAAIGVGPTGLITAAAMVAFLSSMGIFKGAGTSSQQAIDAYNTAHPENTGTGTVLGDTAKQSASIANTLSNLEKMAKPELSNTSKMVALLTSIDQSLGGTAANIIQQGGFATGMGSVNITYTNKTVDTLNKFSDKWNDTLNKFSGSKNFEGIALANKLSNPLMNLMGSLSSKIFGGGTTIATINAGIQFNSQNLKSAMDNLVGTSFQDILLQTSGGWFKKDSASVFQLQSSLDAYTKNQFQLVLKQLYTVTDQAGTTLGESVTTALDNMNISLGKIDLMGKTGEQIQTQLKAVFSSIGDKMAQTALPLLSPFQKIGEGMFETMTRVASGMEQAKYFEDRLASSVVKYSDIINTQGDVATEALRQSITLLDQATFGVNNGVLQIVASLNNGAQDLYDTYATLTSLRFSLTAIGKSVSSLTSNMLYGAGGIDAFKTATSDYISIFLTQSEQLSYQSSTIRAEFTKLNLTMPSSNAGFKALVAGIDTSTSAGQELFGRLILLSKGFGDLTTSVNSSLSSITDDAQKLSDAFTSMSNSIQDTIDKLLGTTNGTSQATMIASFWEKRAKADALLAKRGDLTLAEQNSLQGLVSDLNSLSLSIQGAQVGPTGLITSSLVGQLQDLKSSITLDNAIVQSRILDANGAVVNVATEGTLTRLANAIADRNALLGIDGSHAGGLDYVPYDGYIAQLHKGERVLTAAESNGYGGRTIVSFDTSALEAVNNKIYDRINAMFGILNDAQLGVRPLYVKAQSYDSFRMS